MPRSAVFSDQASALCFDVGLSGFSGSSSRTRYALAIRACARVVGAMVVASVCVLVESVIPVYFQMIHVQIFGQNDRTLGKGRLSSCFEGHTALLQRADKDTAGCIQVLTLPNEDKITNFSRDQGSSHSEDPWRR